MTPVDHIKELKAALDEAASTIEVAGVLDIGVLKARLARYRALANSQAAVMNGQQPTPSFTRYVSQLESLAKQVIADGGPRAEEASLILSRENLRVLGLADDRPQGKFTRVKVNNPRLDEPCTHPNRNGSHETYMEHGRMYCRACGADGSRS